MSVHEAFMALALEEARQAAELGEIPVGAVIVRAGEILARGGNRRETWKDPTAHAEMIVLRKAAEILGDWRLTGCTLYVTLEPCPMCAGAIAMARLDALWYGAADPRMGCCGSVYRITEDPAFAPMVPANGGLLAEACSALLSDFLRDRRRRNSHVSEDLGNPHRPGDLAGQ